MQTPGFKTSFRWLSAWMLALALILPMQDSDARGVGGGGSFSSGRSFSSGSGSRFSAPSAPRSAPSSGSSSTSRSNPPPSYSSSSSARKSAPSTSAADSAFSSKVNRAGTTTSREDYVRDRTSTSAATQRTDQPTRFSSEPSTRPTYIPESNVLPSGRHAPVYYDSRSSGYGFWDDLGRWVLIDSLLNHNRNSGGNYGGNYGGQNPQNSQYAGQSGYGYSNNSTYPYAQRSSSSGGLIRFFLFILIIVAICVWLFLRSTNAATSPLTGHSSATTPPSVNKDFAFKKSAAAAPANIQSWINLAPSDFVTLSDAQALEDSKKRGAGLKGIDFTVETVAVATDSEGFGSWVLVGLDDRHQKLLLLIKGVDEAIDYRVYYPSPDFRPARREEVLSRGDGWLFGNARNVPAGSEGTLRYTPEINFSNEGQSVLYVLKAQGERQADYREKPAISGLGDLVATMVEYSSADPTPNPELLVVEIGAADHATGEISLYLGCPIQPGEIDLVKA